MIRLTSTNSGEPRTRERVISAVKHVVPTLAVCMLGMGLMPVTAWAASDAALTGVVRDAHGAPQLGALVELLAPDATVLARAFTDDHGRYFLYAVLPGNYQLRASAAFLVPVLRGNLHLNGGARTVADLTMTAIFEAGKWLPTEKPTAAEPRDDWRWTLRSTANRPLLRLAGAPSAGASSSSDHARTSVAGGQIAFMSGDGSFGEGGNRQVVTIGRSVADGDASILKADLGNNTSGVGTSVVLGVGLEHERTWGGGTRLFVSFASHPELQTETSSGLQVLHTAATEKIALGDAVMVDAGTLFTAEHLLGTRFSSAPYVRVAFRPSPELTLEYRLATDRSLQTSDDLDQVSVREEALVDTAGMPLIVKGLHQEISLTQTDERRTVSVAVFHDNNPTDSLGGGGVSSEHDLTALPAIYDPTTDTLRLAAKGESTAGVRIAWTENFSPVLSACIEGEVGGALKADNPSIQLIDLAAQLHPHTVAALGGELHMHTRRTGTRVEVGYRWQPARSLTQVDRYDANPEDAYLSLHFQQKLWAGRRLKGLNAVVEATNLLSQGYEPVVGPDGQTFFLAQVPRGIQGGFAFNF